MAVGKRGRPFKEIDIELLKKLASIWCTYKEMASMLNCSVEVLEKRYKEIIDEAKEAGKASLRRMLWNAAAGPDGTGVGGSPKALGLLCSNVLNMVEKKEFTTNHVQPYIIEWIDGNKTEVGIKQIDQDQQSVVQ